MSTGLTQIGLGDDKFITNVLDWAVELYNGNFLGRLCVMM